MTIVVRLTYHTITVFPVVVVIIVVGCTEEMIHDTGGGGPSEIKWCVKSQPARRCMIVPWNRIDGDDATLSW